MDYYAPLNNPATEALPRPPYVNGNAAAGIKGSYPPAELAEHPMREILAVIEAAGIEPSRDDLTQLLQAIQILIANQTGTVVGGGGGGAGPVVYNNKQVFLYTGADQNFVVPATATMLKFKIWGAAGGIWSGDPNGSAGGFTLAEFNLADGPIAPGAALKLMVGEGGLTKGVAYASGNVLTPATYGFGGASRAGASNGAWPGGGLSGVFSGSAAILASQASRALAIAGGGGGSIYHSRPGQPHSNGGYGNSLASGGQTSMQGQSATELNDGGGGGGYNGGDANAMPYINPEPHHDSGGAGRGGKGFVHADAVAAQILAQVAGVSPPMPYDPDYVAGTGVATLTGNGLIVAEWYIPA